MPTTKSALKAMRSSARKRTLNLATMSKYKSAVKNARKALQGDNKVEAQKALSAAYSQIDKAAKKRVIHRNKAARLKSRLSVNQAKSK